jgi:hypothetical protein
MTLNLVFILIIIADDFITRSRGFITRFLATILIDAAFG